MLSYFHDLNVNRQGVPNLNTWCILKIIGNILFKDISYIAVADQGLILTLTYMARHFDPELHCGPGLVGLATILNPHTRNMISNNLLLQIMSRGFQLTKAKEITNKSM